MKKTLALLMAITMLFSLTSCSTIDDIKNMIMGGNSENSGALQYNEGLLFIEVTLNASLFKDMTAEEIKAKAAENGITQCTVNADGSVVYKMTKSKHKEMLEQYKTSMTDVITGLLEGEGKVASFVAIEPNDNLSQIDIYVDSSLYTMWDSMGAMAFYMIGAYYQSFAGVPAEEIDIVVNFIDNATKEVLDTASYKKFMSNK